MLKRRTVDVVVPVQGDGEELRACVQSVAHHGGDHRLIVIDDCSADARAGVLLHELSAQRSSRLVVVRNDRPLGFAASANRGMAVGRNDVALLGPGMRVTRGWLDKLARCAASDPTIGLATPLLDEEDGGGIPHGGRSGAAPADPELVNRAAEASAVPLYPDVVSAKRGCMYIRRTVLRKIGAFDERLGDGDDVEADFSARARAAGFRTVLCDDTSVVGRGLRSDACAKSTPEPAGNDSIAAIRGMIRSQVAVLSRNGCPGVLHVVHGRGGGTEKYVQELIGATRDDYRHYFLRILDDRWLVTDGNGAVPTAYEWRRSAEEVDSDWLGSLCAWLGIELVHVHSLVGSGDDLVRLLDAAALPYCYSVHDMYLACPTVYLIGDDDDYCNATTDSSACRRCLSNIAGLAHTDIEGWRHRYREFLGRASCVVAPSEWARDTIARYYPAARTTVAPPGLAPWSAGPARKVTNGWLLPEDERRNVGLLGAVGPEKGARLLERLAARIRERGLPLRLILIGYTDRENRHQSDDKVLIIHGRYDGEEIESLLDYYRIPLVAFPTVWPETFSYTLSETWMAGRPALVPPRGALQERVLATGAGWIMDGWPDVDAMLDQLVALTAWENAGELERRARQARAVFRDACGTPEPMQRIYRDMLENAPDRPAPVVSRRQIHEAACRAVGIEPAGRPAVSPSKGTSRNGTTKGRLMRLFRG